jgi:nicotinate-nucleotide pyrophosphorylase
MFNGAGVEGRASKSPTIIINETYGECQKNFKQENFALNFLIRTSSIPKATSSLVFQ